MQGKIGGDVLKVVNFSNKVNANVLEGFIFWNVQLGEELKPKTSEVFKTSEVSQSCATPRAAKAKPQRLLDRDTRRKFVMGSDKGGDNERPATND